VPRKTKKARSSAQSRSKRRDSPRNHVTPVTRSSANSTTLEKGPKMPLTGIRKKPGPKSHLFGNTLSSAHHALLVLSHSKEKIDLPKLMTAESESDLTVALREVNDQTRSLLVDRWGAAILLWAKEKKYPQYNEEAILRHLADSIGGEGNVSPRRSRDICDGLRREKRNTGQIIRREFYVECTCGYRGPALRDACPDCGAPVSYMDFQFGLGRQS
jgi:hypothetical protein